MKIIISIITSLLLISCDKKEGRNYDPKVIQERIAPVVGSIPSSSIKGLEKKVDGETYGVASFPLGQKTFSNESVIQWADAAKGMNVSRVFDGIIGDMFSDDINYIGLALPTTAPLKMAQWSNSEFKYFVFRQDSPEEWIYVYWEMK